MLRVENKLDLKNHNNNSIIESEIHINQRIITQFSLRIYIYRTIQEFFYFILLIN